MCVLLLKLLVITVMPVVAQTVEIESVHTLYDQTMDSHRQCRMHLEVLVTRSAETLRVEPVKVRDESDIIGGTGTYTYFLRPANSEIMSFECKNNQLIVSYRFL